MRVRWYGVSANFILQSIFISKSSFSICGRFMHSGGACATLQKQTETVTGSPDDFHCGRQRVAGERYIVDLKHHIARMHASKLCRSTFVCKQRDIYI